MYPSEISTLINQAFRILLLTASSLLGCSLLALSIVERSPFVPSGFNPGSTSSQETKSAPNPQGLQFKGMYELNDSLYFLVSERNQKGKWIEMGQADEEIQVSRFDKEDNRLLVDVSGKEVWLDLVETAAVTGNAVAASQPSSRTSRTTVTPRTSTSRSSIRPTSPTRSVTPTRSSSSRIRPASNITSASSLRSLQRRRPISGISSRSRTATVDFPVPSAKPPTNLSLEVPDTVPTTKPGPPPTNTDSPFN